VTHTLGFRFPAEVDDEAAMNKVRELMPYALAKGYMFYPLVLIKAKELVLACPELDPSWLINVAHPSPPANANVKWIEVRCKGPAPDLVETTAAVARGGAAAAAAGRGGKASSTTWRWPSLPPVTSRLVRSCSLPHMTPTRTRSRRQPAGMSCRPVQRR